MRPDYRREDVVPPVPTEEYVPNDAKPLPTQRGTVLGLAGVSLISVDPWRASLPIGPLIAILLSVLCFAQALIVVRRMPPVHPIALNAMGMVFGAVLLFVMSSLLGEPKALPDRNETWMALVYVVAVLVATTILWEFVAMPVFTD